MFEEKQVQTIVELGLTNLQAKVYLSILCLGTATAKEARDNSKVARQDIYRILKELHKLRLIEKTISRPTRFKAIPLQEATSILFGHKTKKILQLKTKTKELLHNFKKPNTEIVSKELYPTFTLIPKTKDPLKNAYKSRMKAQKSIDTISTATRVFYIIKNYRACLEQSIQNGVESRFIIEKTKDAKTIKGIEQFAAKTHLFEVRYISQYHTTSIVAIIDKKEVNIAISPTNNGVTEDYTLYSNSKELVEIISNYFELMWNQATSNRINSYQTND